MVIDMKKRTTRRIRILAGFLAAVLGLTGGLAYSRIEAQAVLDESTAVKYSVFSGRNTVENGTLFIGTYLIHMSAMTEELYEKAQTSAEDSGQYDIYYKSELANGEWFDISSAEGLADITDAAEPVEDAELADLWVTFYVGEDGTVRSAKDGTSVCIFDQPSPYDLYRLSELETLRNQYDNTYNSETKGANRYFYDQLRNFFGLNLRNAVTNECDRQISLLQGVYDRLKQQEEDEQAEIVYTLMGKIDAKRQAEVFYQLMEAEDSRLNQLQTILGGSAYNKDSYDGEQFMASADLSDAIGTAMESCESSYITYSSDQISNDESVLGETEYTLSMSILQKVESGNTDLDEELLKLKNLYSIKDSVIKDKDGELAYLEQELIPEAESRLKSAITSGAGQEYNAAVAQGKSKAACDKILSLQKTEQDKLLNEYQFLIKAKTERMSSQAAVDYLLDQIEEIGSCYNDIKDDAYAENAQAGADACLSELQELAQSVIDGDSSMQSTLSGLESDKEDIQTLRDAALDQNDLALAKKYDAMIDEIDARIAEEEKSLSDQLADATPVERAKAMTQLGSKTQTANVAKIQNNAKKKLAEGDMSGVVEAADALAELGEENALKDLLASMGTDTTDTVRNALEAALKQVQENGNGTGSGDSGTGSGTDNFGLSGDELLALLESALGDSFDDMDDADQAAALGALSEFGAAGSSEAAALAATLASDAAKNGNKNLFVGYTGSGAEKYISAQTIGRVTEFRYVYSASRRDAVLSSNGRTYRYSVGSSEVRLSDGTIEQMSSETVLQGNVAYIPEEAAGKYHGCTVITIEGTAYAVCVTEDMETTVDQLLENLKGGTD